MTSPRTALMRRLLVRRYLKVARQITAGWRRKGWYTVGWRDLLALHQAAWFATWKRRGGQSHPMVVGVRHAEVAEDVAMRALAETFEIDQDAFVEMVRAVGTSGPAPDDIDPPAVRFPEEKVIIPDDESFRTTARSLLHGLSMRVPPGYR